MPGAQLAPAALCANEKSTQAKSPQVRRTIRHSLRDGFTVCFVLSPVTGLFCHRRLRNCFRQLDASVGASGPHDFAVRLGVTRQRHRRVHRIPHPTFVTIAKRPSYRGGTAETSGGDLADGTSKIFFEEGLDDPNQLESLQQIVFYAHAISAA